MRDGWFIFRTATGRNPKARIAPSLWPFVPEGNGVKVTKKFCLAVHEAGHTIAASSVGGIVINRVSIEPTTHGGETILGHLEYTCTDSPEDLRGELITILAGRLAVAKLKGKSAPRDLPSVLAWLEKVSPIDAAMIRDVLQELCGADLEPDRVFAEAFQAAEQLLDRRWNAVIGLAEILKDISPTLEGQHLADILATFLP